MNYIFIRIVIFILLILLTRVAFRYISSENVKKYYFITITVLFISICIYPIENKLIKFNSSANAFSYYYPTSKIMKKYEYNDYAYIVFEMKGDGGPGFMHLIKENGTWKINNLLTKGRVLHKMYAGCSMAIIKLKENDSIGIALYHIFTDGIDGKISDSLSSDFEKFVTDMDEFSQLNVDVVILNEKVDKNYTIYLNGKEYKPFKK